MNSKNIKIVLRTLMQLLWKRKTMLLIIILSPVFVAVFSFLIAQFMVFPNKDYIPDDAFKLHIEEILNGTLKKYYTELEHNGISIGYVNPIIGSKVNASLFIMSVMFSVIFLPLNFISIGVVLMGFKDSTYFKRMMISKVSKKDIITAFSIFVFIVIMFSFLVYSLLNIHWIVTLISAPKGILVTHLFPEFMKYPSIEQYDWSNIGFTVNTFNFWSYLSFIFVISIFLSSLIVSLTSVLRRLSSYVLSFLAVVIIGPVFYQMIGIIGFGVDAEQLPDLFISFYPLTLESFSSSLQVNLFSTKVDSFGYMKLIMPLVYSLIALPLSYKLWKWKES